MPWAKCPCAKSPQPPAGPNATNLTITKNGTTGPAFWRFFGHYVFHEDTMIKQYEHDLQQRAASQP